jgi:hypothetical protein
LHGTNAAGYLMKQATCSTSDVCACADPCCHVVNMLTCFQAEVDLLKERFSQLLAVLKGPGATDDPAADVGGDALGQPNRGPAVIEGILS